MVSDSESSVGDPVASQHSESGEGVGQVEGKWTCDMRVDSCLICGEPAVFYDAEGDVIKRERSSGQFSYQQLFHCLCKCVQLRKNCRLKKDWDFYKDPFPACESCEQLLISLAELYSRVELAEEELKILIHRSEDKFVSFNLYAKHEDKYRSFRKRVLKNECCGGDRGILLAACLSKNRNLKPDDTGGDGLTEVCLLSNKTPASSQQITSSEGTTQRRSRRKLPILSNSYASSDDDKDSVEDDYVSEGDSKPPSHSTLPDDTSRSIMNSDADEPSTAECTTSTTTKKKAPCIIARPKCHPSPEKSKRARSKARGPYKPRKKKKKIHTIFSRCPVCDKPIGKEAVEEYKEHYWTHLSEEEKRAFYTDNEVPNLSTIPPMNSGIHRRKAAPFPERKESGDMVQCQTCGKFVGKVTLGQHERTHVPLEKRQIYLCNLCGVSFVQQRSLDSHLNKVHPDGSILGAFKCLFPHCNSSYSSQSNLKSHVQQVHCSSSHLQHPKKYLCNECGRLLSNPQLLKQHGLVHSKERKHACHHCSKTFPLKTTLVSHLEAVHGEGKQVFVCAQIGCSQEFPTRAYYSCHLRQVHGIFVGKDAKQKKLAEGGKITQETKKFPCAVCGVAFTSKFSLKYHLNKVHPTGKEGPYVCFFPNCTFNVFTERDLRSHVEQDHVASYEGDKHLCGLCGRVFRDAYGLNKHQLVHTKERSHACHICSKAFPLKATLVMHLEAVHGEGRKEFKCEQEGCTEVFPTRVYFMCHMRRVHGIYAKGKRNSVKRMSSKL